MSYTPPDQEMPPAQISTFRDLSEGMLDVINRRLANPKEWSEEHRAELKKLRRKLEKVGRLCERLREAFP